MNMRNDPTTPRDQAIEAMAEAIAEVTSGPFSMLTNDGQHIARMEAVAALNALFDLLSEPLSTIPQRVRGEIQASEPQLIALAITEAELRSFINTLREKG